MHDPASLWEFLDRALVHFADAEGGAWLSTAQTAFLRLTGEYEPGQRWYEERVRLFHDWFLFEHLLPDGRVPLAAFAQVQAASLPEAQRDIYAELLRTGHRSLFEVERRGAERLRLHDRLGGAEFDIDVEPELAGVATCDLLDARLLRSGDALVVSRGLLVHPRQAREAILALVPQARETAGRVPWELLDVLARMKLAWDRAENPKVAATYGPESYLFRDWAKGLVR